MTLQRRELIAAGLASTFLPMQAWSQTIEKPKVSIAVGGKNLFYYLPLTIAEQLGYFKEAGLDVTIVDFAGGSRALQAVVGGSADVVSGAFEHTLNMQFKGQPMRAFVLQGAAPQIVLGVNPKTMPNYKTVADLKGKKNRRHCTGQFDQCVGQFRVGQSWLETQRCELCGGWGRQRRCRRHARRPN